MDGVRPTVVIADDHAEIIAAVRSLLDSTCEVIGEAADGRELVELSARLAPDLMVIDLGMPRMSGLEALKECRAAGSTAIIIILTVSAEPALAEVALRAGANAYVIKDRLGEDLLVAIDQARAGAEFVSRMN